MGPPIYDYTEAQVDKVIWKVVPEENTRVTALQAGQADASQYVPYWSIKELQANKNLSVTKAENFFWTYFIGFKVDKELVSDVRVRQAMNLAVDQKAITEAVTFGFAEPASTMLMPNVLDFNAKLNRAAYGENVKEAEKLLDEAGWKKGPTASATRTARSSPPSSTASPAPSRRLPRRFRATSARSASICRSSSSTPPSRGASLPPRSSTPSA